MPHTNTFYNPETNELITNRHFCFQEGFESVGSRKIAEAMTAVKEEDRPLIWKARESEKYWGIDLTMLPSRLRHKLKRLGITEYYATGPRTAGEYLLQKIKKKV